jgi:hypothetical protein
MFNIDVIKSDRNLITKDKYKDIQQLKEKVNRILSIISRDHMKVVFFGRFILISCCYFKNQFCFIEQVMGKVRLSMLCYEKEYYQWVWDIQQIVFFK